MEEAVREVTNAVLGHDGACLPGRENNPDFVEVSFVVLFWEGLNSFSTQST